MIIQRLLGAYFRGWKHKDLVILKTWQFISNKIIFWTENISSFKKRSKLWRVWHESSWQSFTRHKLQDDTDGFWKVLGLNMHLFFFHISWSCLSFFFISRSDASSQRSLIPTAQSKRKNKDRKEIPNKDNIISDREWSGNRNREA